MEPLELILFDLDGTLFLSTPILHGAYVRGLQRLESSAGTQRVPTEEEILNQVGNPAPRIYENLFPDLPEADRLTLQGLILDELVQDIREGEGELIDSVHEVMVELRRQWDLALVTNARRAYMEAVCDTYGLDQYFQRMRCAEDFQREEKSVIVRDALEFFGVSPDKTLLVGDRSSDRKAAREVGTRFVGCEFGYGGREEFQQEFTISRFKDLLDRLGLAQGDSAAG